MRIHGFQCDHCRTFATEPAPPGAMLVEDLPPGWLLVVEGPRRAPPVGLTFCSPVCLADSMRDIARARTMSVPAVSADVGAGPREAGKREGEATTWTR